LTRTGIHPEIKSEGMLRAKSAGGANMPVTVGEDFQTGVIYRPVRKPAAGWRPGRPSGIHEADNENGLPMTCFAASTRSRRMNALAVAGMICLSASPLLAADDEAPPKGAAVTVLKAQKSCFANIVEVSGTIIPREENQVRPRLTLPEGGQIAVQAPVGGVISATTAAVGAMASAKGEALFSIIARGEFDLVGLVPTRDIQKLQVNQAARIKVIGAGEVDGKVRRLSTTVEPNSQLAQVFLGVTTNRRLLVNSSGRAQIKTGQSCGVSVPLTAILYGSAGTVVQVVRRARVETRRVETGLMSAGQVEITSGVAEGDIVVARAGALLREGDPVRAVTASAEPK
jgi:HlyD family secretion protein